MNRRAYFDNPVHALVAHQLHGIRILKYPTPEQAREYESKAPWDWLETCTEEFTGSHFDMANDALQYLFQCFGNAKLYVHPEDFDKVTKGQEGDLVAEWDGYFWSGHMLQSAEDVEKFNKSPMDKMIVQRNDLPFPVVCFEVEEENAAEA